MRIEQRERLPGDLRRWLAFVGAVLLIGAGVAVLQLCGAQVCVLRRLTGWPCLTCGSTRAFAALLSGHVMAALKLQPFAVAAGLLAGAACGLYSVSLLVCRRVIRVRLGRRERLVFWGAVIAAAVLNWLYLVRSNV